MEQDLWGQLSAPFPQKASLWRVSEVTDDGSSARVSPQLQPEAIIERLDRVLGTGGWSNHYHVAEGSVVCSLTVYDGERPVMRSVVLPLKSPVGTSDPLQRAGEALSLAAEQFGLRSPIPAGDYWVDYDSDHHSILYEPDLSAVPRAPLPVGEAQLEEEQLNATQPNELQDESESSEPPASELPKSAGQLAIDKLVDRLNGQGRGLEAARLINRYGGYGKDPEVARDLYRELRGLLLGQELT